MLRKSSDGTAISDDKDFRRGTQINQSNEDPLPKSGSEPYSERKWRWSSGFSLQSESEQHISVLIREDVRDRAPGDLEA
jgi:hypothetical protein